MRQAIIQGNTVIVQFSEYINAFFKLTLAYLQQKVWTLYDESCAASGITAVAFTTFADLWIKLLPHIRVGKPMADLCITRLMNKPEEEKSEVCICSCNIN